MSAIQSEQAKHVAQADHAKLGVADLAALYYEELKLIARKRRKLEASNTLSTTVLVHDLFLQMSARGELKFDRPVQFYAYAAQAMRHMLIDRARSKLRAKAGGQLIQIGIEDAEVSNLLSIESRAIELDDAVTQLRSIDAKAAQVVELHFFAGQAFEQIAVLLECSRRTISRDWEFARAFLLKNLK